MSAKAEDLVCPECGKGDKLQEVWWTCSQAPIIEPKKVGNKLDVEPDYDCGKTYWDALVEAGLCCQGCGWGLDVWPKIPEDAPDSSQLVTAAEWKKRGKVSA